MSVIYYLVPVVAIVGMLFYTKWAQANVQKRAAAGEGPQMFHEAYAQKFEALHPDERLIGIWMGLAYITPTNTVGQVAGKLAKEAALGVVGMSTYTPTVYVGLTTQGRVLVSEEYSDMGERNHFKVVCALPAGAQVIVGREANPEHQGSPPRNPYSADAPLELVRLMGQNEQYLCWVTGAGAMTGASSFVSISSVLPITPERASNVWHEASRPATAA
ncbi:MAG TPA: hypothetical protein VG937_23620 [Polyangiaceae bacterium]|jgi:hypothetical protein|nr:hypothetical protein [Polyangiaceae bacterium]